MQHPHHRCDLDLTAPGRRRISRWAAAATLAVTCLAGLATPSGAATTADPKAAAATAPAAAAPVPKAKAATRPTAGGAKVRVSPYARFRREREAADRANGAGSRLHPDLPAGQAQSRRMPK
jgi:hypothetical protein